MWLRVVKKNCRTTMLHLQEADTSGFIRFDGFWFGSKGAAATQGTGELVMRPNKEWKWAKPERRWCRQGGVPDRSDTEGFVFCHCAGSLSRGY